MKTLRRIILSACTVLGTVLPVAGQQPSVEALVTEGLAKAKNSDVAGAVMAFERAWLMKPDFAYQRFQAASFYHKTGTKLMLTKQISASLVFFDRALRLIDDEGSFIQARTLAEKLKPMEKRGAAGSSRKSMSLSGPRTGGLQTDATSGGKMELSARNTGTKGDITLEIAIAFSSLAGECQAAGDTKNAIAYYKDALVICPDMDMARMALEELSAGTETTE